MMAKRNPYGLSRTQLWREATLRLLNDLHLPADVPREREREAVAALRRTVPHEAPRVQIANNPIPYGHIPDKVWDQTAAEWGHERDRMRAWFDLQEKAKAASSGSDD